MDGVKSGNEYSEIGPSASNRYCSSKRRQVGAEEHEVGLCHCHIYESIYDKQVLLLTFYPMCVGKDIVIVHV